MRAPEDTLWCKGSPATSFQIVSPSIYISPTLTHIFTILRDSIVHQSMVTDHLLSHVRLQSNPILYSLHKVQKGSYQPGILSVVGHF